MKLNALLNKKILTESECVHILTLIRQELEASDTKSIFDCLNFFCDWSLHTKIDHSMAGSVVIVNIHKVLNDNKHSDNDALIKNVSEQFIGMFKKQLKEFLNKKSLPSSIVDNDIHWKNFIQIILEIISHKSVMLIEKKHGEEVSKAPLKEGMWASEISIAKINPSNPRDINSVSSNAIFCLVLLTSDSTSIIIPITP